MAKYCQTGKRCNLVKKFHFQRSRHLLNMNILSKFSEWKKTDWSAQVLTDHCHLASCSAVFLILNSFTDLCFLSLGVPKAIWKESEKRNNCNSYDLRFTIFDFKMLTLGELMRLTVISSKFKSKNIDIRQCTCVNGRIQLIL